MNRQQLLKRLAEAWAALTDSCAGLTEPEMMLPGVMGEWSVQDILGHVTTWEDEALKYLPLIVQGGTPPRYSTRYGGVDAFNAQMSQQKRALPISEVLRQMDEVHARLIDYLQTASEDLLTGNTRFRRRLRLDTYGHYPIHARAIREWRERASHSA
jgi:hypothetical protein